MSVQFVGPEHTLQIFGIRMIGVNADTGKKLVFTLVFILIVIGLRYGLRLIARLIAGKREDRLRFWTRQIISIIIAVIFITGLISIWFRNPAQLGSAAAFITAGLAVASQRVITVLAGYFIILRGKNFNVGDRIVMGGVRGDVISLGFMQTSIMEMGQPPGEQGDAPSMWVAGRQYTGRIVSITNDKIFENPVYNYTREFPYIWDEIRLPIPYKSDRTSAERIILDAVKRHTTKIADLGEKALAELEKRYVVERAELEPRVFYRLTDNWVEMAVRFIVEDHGVRSVKDRISREILEGFDARKIEIASGTYEVVGMPELKVCLENTNGNS